MEQMRQLYAAADLYASPYRAEGFNLPVIEAVACGCPVLVTRGGATDDFFEPFMGLQIRSEPASRLAPNSKSDSARTVHFQEPDYEDFKRGLRSFIERTAPTPGTPNATWLTKRSWGECTRLLLDRHLLAD
jgi:glycosyltransferase involved in cell wall biosynthesis